MTIDNIFQYVIDDGYIGGIIIADSLEDAIEKLRIDTEKRYPDLKGERSKGIIWNIKDNSHHENDVYEIFNEQMKF